MSSWRPDLPSSGFARRPDLNFVKCGLPKRQLSPLTYVCLICVRTSIINPAVIHMLIVCLIAPKNGKVFEAMLDVIGIGIPLPSCLAEC